MFLVINPAKCWEWDPMGLKKNIERIKEMMNGLVDKLLAGMGDLMEKAKNAINNVLDKLFDEKLMALLNKIQELIDKNLKQIDSYIQGLIDNVMDKVSQLVDQMTRRVKEIITETADQIQKKIIGEFFGKASELVSQVTDDIHKILNRIDDGIYHIYCSERTAANQILNFVSSNLPWYNPWSDRCRDQMETRFPGHNLKWKFFYSYTQNEIYEYKKCLNMIDLDPMTTPVNSVVLALRDIELLAGDMRCVSVALRADVSINYYAQEMAECVSLIHLLSFSTAHSEVMPEVKNKFRTFARKQLN